MIVVRAVIEIILRASPPCRRPPLCQARWFGGVVASRRSGLTSFGKFLNCRPNMASIWNLNKPLATSWGPLTRGLGYLDGRLVASSPPGPEKLEIEACRLKAPHMKPTWEQIGSKIDPWRLLGGLRVASGRPWGAETGV